MATQPWKCFPTLLSSHLFLWSEIFKLAFQESVNNSRSHELLFENIFPQYNFINMLFGIEKRRNYKICTFIWILQSTRFTGSHCEQPRKIEYWWRQTVDPEECPFWILHCLCFVFHFPQICFKTSTEWVIAEPEHHHCWLQIDFFHLKIYCEEK